MSMSIPGQQPIGNLLLTLNSGGPEEEEVREGLRRTRTCTIAGRGTIDWANRGMHIELVELDIEACGATHGYVDVLLARPNVLLIWSLLL